MGLGGFSWKRAVGLSAARARLSRRIGIPFTKSGRQRKIGKLITGGGCLVVLAFMAAIPVVVVAVVFAFLRHS
jgi:hypothetical protein